ncbi:MAG: superoxide dismutase [Candidatus Absconditabacterales bacterium]
MFTLLQLPYSFNALEPFIDEQTVQIHYLKHHQGYVDKLNGLIKGTEYENSSLEEIIKKSEGAIFNNAAQIWNHSFYRECMKSGSIDNQPEGIILEKIEEKRGTFHDFKDEFTNSAVGNFGSGRTWIVKNSDGNIEIINTINANNPIVENKVPLLTVDIREHAYYLKYQNRRIEYVSNRRNLVNRNKIEENFNK